MSKANIMIVEDEYIVSMYMKTLLEQMGYTVCAMETSGEKAFESIAKSRPDMILMDISLDGQWDGIETAERIRMQWRIPVIFSTAFTDDDLLTRAKQVDPAGYLLKPLDPRQLTIAIDMALHRAEMDERLRKSEERFRLMVEASPFPTYIVDKRGGFLYANRKFTEVFGYTATELRDLETWFTKLYPDPAYRRDAREKWSAGLQNAPSGEPNPLEFDIRCKDGAIKTILFRVARAGRDTDMITAEDITHRKQIGDELLKTKKLEAVGILAGGIAHDFNNLLSVIMGNINLSQMAVAPESDIARWLGEAEKASMRAKNLTQKFTTFSSGGKPVKKVTSLRNIVENAVGLAITGSSAACSYDIPGDLWKVEIDSEQMNQVLNHIALNAIDAMPRGGTIRIGAENIEVSDGNDEPLAFIEEGKYVKIAVRDEGLGIPRENLAAIFDPYFSTKRRGSQKGMGFGLPISHAIIKKHGGHIQVESKEGVGTTVFIFLPATEVEGTDSKSASTGNPSLKNRRVLLMDDEEMIRDLVSQMLEFLEYRTDTTANGEEAVAAYISALESEDPYDAVILDLTVPGAMGGKEALEKLREIDPEIRAVVSSGYATDDLVYHYEQWGFVGRIAKPFQIKDLDKLLRRVIGGRNF
jgi:two-component system, cell cycle sensor histidine kinase and response regulator CckA